MALELVTLAFFASVRLTADTSENFLITLDEIAALIGAIIAVFTTPIAKFFDVIFCERKEWIGIEERSSA